MSRLFHCALPVFLALVVAACDKMPLTAPSGSTVRLVVNTTELPLNGTAQITAVVTENGGTPPQNGTVVTFTSTLGSIDPRDARTTNGLATATFNAGPTAGTARIGALSGGATADVVEVAIGAGTGGFIALNAVPGPSGTATVIATVLDQSGNRLRGTVVAFSADVGQVSPRTATTDSNGEARTTVTTSGRTTVTARTGAITGTIVIDSSPVGVTLTATPNPVSLDETTQGGLVAFTATATAPTGATILSYEWSFGDGSPNRTTTGASTNHEYTQPGTYPVRVRVRASNGAEGNGEILVRVNPAP